MKKGDTCEIEIEGVGVSAIRSKTKSDRVATEKVILLPWAEALSAKGGHREAIRFSS
jgi:hypothetical protein